MNGAYGVVFGELVTNGTSMGLFLVIVGLLFLLGLQRVFLALYASRRVDASDRYMDFLEHGLRKERWGTALSTEASVGLHKALEDYQESALFPRSFLSHSVYETLKRRFDERHLEAISRYSNLLPPLGFLGTVMGMMGVFLFQAQGVTASEEKSLGLALTTTLVALLLHALLEVLKIPLVGRAQSAIESGLETVLRQNRKPPSPPRSAE